MSSMPPGEPPSEPPASEPTVEPVASTPAFPPSEPPAQAASWPAAPPPADPPTAEPPPAAVPPATVPPAAPPAAAAATTDVPWAAAATPPPAAPAAVYWATTDDPGPAPGIEFAGHGGRLVAYVLDGIIVTILGAILFIIGVIAAGSGATVVGNRVTSISTGGSIVALIFWLLAIVVYVLYFPFFWARGGQTPGMRPFGLRVVRDRDGSRIGWGTALLRLVGLYVAFAVLYIGLIWIFIDKRRRGWQDLIAGTVMIKRP